MYNVYTHDTYIHTYTFTQGSNVDATIDTLCDMMCDKQRSPLESYVAVSDYFMQEEHIPYWDASFADEIAYLKRTEWAVAIGGTYAVHYIIIASI